MNDYLVFEEGREIYNLGNLKKPRRFQLDCLQEGPLIVHYNKSSGKGDIMLEERVGFTPDDRDDLLLDDHLQERYNSHPYLGDDKFLAVIKRTKNDGSTERVMEVPPRLNPTVNYFEDAPYDLSEWDDDIIQRLKHLPPHVRDVLGL